MKLNRKWLLVIALVMSLTMATAGTLAYLTSTDTETNTFTVGNVKIDLTETSYAGDDQILLPGVEIKKNPQITNTGNTVAWVWMTIEMPNKLYNTLNIDWNTVDWEKSVGVNNEGEIVVTMKRASKLMKNDTTPAAFTRVLIPATVTDLSALGTTTDITVTAYGIQDANFADIDKAIAAFKGNGSAPATPSGTAAANATDLEAAFNQGGEVYLSDDITVNTTVVVPSDKAVTLNLNGHDLSYAVSNAGASAIINNKGDLTISGVGVISFVADKPDLGTIPWYATNTITNTGTLTINDGVTVKNGSEGGASYAVDNHGKFTMNGGTLEADRCALRVAKYNQDDVVFIMNGGLITAKTPAWIQLPGSDSNVAPKITVDINNGTLLSTKPSSADNNVMYTYSYGNSHANTSITIDGGYFLGGTVSIGSGYKGNAPALEIKDGTFDYDVLQWLENDNFAIIYSANN